LRDVARLEGRGRWRSRTSSSVRRPKAGESRLLDGRRMLEQLTQAGLDVASVTYTLPPTIRVRRATQELTATAVRQLVEDDLRRRLGADASGLVLRTVELPAPIRIPTGTWDGHVVLPPGAALVGRTRVQLDVTVDGQPARSTWITLDVGRLTDVVVVTRAVAAGEVVTADAIALDRQDLSTLPRDIVTDPGGRRRSHGADPAGRVHGASRRARRRGSGGEARRHRAARRRARRPPHHGARRGQAGRRAG
jgi:hypothetical protein